MHVLFCILSILAFICRKFSTSAKGFLWQPYRFSFSTHSCIKWIHRWNVWFRTEIFWTLETEFKPVFGLPQILYFYSDRISKTTSWCVFSETPFTEMLQQHKQQAVFNLVAFNAIQIFSLFTIKSYFWLDLVYFNLILWHEIKWLGILSISLILPNTTHT